MTPQTQNPILTYRADIDGLRAIAVLSAIIFHINNQWLPGGFVGVDIFFVISGFLITTIISKQTSQGSFSYAEFYTRRIRRLMPVYFSVIFFVLAVGAVLLTANDLTKLEKSVRYASFFAANFFFSAEQDYFAIATNQMPLLHTWSLAVEEQFYFIWPIILLVILRLAPKYTVMAIIAFILASLSLGTYFALKETSASWNYYHLPARIGELLAGGLLAFYKPNIRFPQLFATAGILLIISSLLLLDTSSVFPGYNTIWPCLGAALIIYSGNDNKTTWVGKLLAIKPLVFIGLLSYSLYLWHWPILAFARYYNMTDTLPIEWVAICILTTFILAYLVWRYIEQPIRVKKLDFKQSFKKYYFTPLVLVIIATLTIKHTKGFLFDTEAPQLQKMVVDRIGCIGKLQSDCSIGSDNTALPVETVLYGDSHARHFSVMFDSIAKKDGWRLDFMGINGCPFLPSFNAFYDQNYSKCISLSDQIFSNFDSYSNIIMSTRWSLYLSSKNGHHYPEALKKHVVSLANSGKNVFLIKQVPEFKYDVYKAIKFKKGNNPQVKTTEADDLLEEIAAMSDRIHIIDLSDTLNQWENGAIAGKPGYMDSNHLNHYGQILLSNTDLDSKELIKLGKLVKATSPAK